MIIDKLENTKLYKGINNRIKKALIYLETENFKKLNPGKYEIDGNNIFAIINEYSTKMDSDQLLEAHKKYIDIQYMAKGNENIGTTFYDNQQPFQTYNDEDDYLLFKEPYSLNSLNEGMFAIFFPDDIHKPGIIKDKPMSVKKVVIKVKI